MEGRERERPRESTKAHCQEKTAKDHGLHNRFITLSDVFAVIQVLLLRREKKN